DPYAVWLSEVMLQQTTVATVKSYFEAFISRWPDVTALAAAPRDDVLSAWAGLGYYARARNMHAAAIIVARDHNGRFPDTEEELRRLPGIGAYTAAAIAAIAFGRHAVVVDGNIERVTARWQAVETPLPKAKPALTAVMAALTPADRAGDFAQAMMDLGAMICTPARRLQSAAGLSQPACDQCPLAETCLGRHADPGRLPLKAPKKPQPQRHGSAVIFHDGAGGVVLEERPDRGMLGGMLIFPGSDWAGGSPDREDYPISPESPVAGLLAEAESRRILNSKVEHVFTHFRLHLRLEEALISRATPLPPACRWVAMADLPSLALPTVMRKVARAAGLV
ncbi:MAG: A/G-specific adenine glycosylase, partial [Candidatus Puniceispirillales bacterium]